MTSWRIVLEYVAVYLAALAALWFFIGWGVYMVLRAVT
jgi:hypothetical protein